MESDLYTVTIFFMSIENHECECRRTLNGNSIREVLQRMALLLKRTNREFVIDNMLGWSVSKGSTYHINIDRRGTILDMLMEANHV